MNSLLSKYALEAAAFVFLLQSSTPTPVIVELKRSDGTTIVGIVKDKQHFLDCHENEIQIQLGDKIASTDRTCKNVVDDSNCRMCAYHPGGLGAGDYAPATTSGEAHKNQPAAAIDASKPNPEAQDATSKADRQDEFKLSTASTGASGAAGVADAKSKAAGKKKSTKKAEGKDKQPPI